MNILPSPIWPVFATRRLLLRRSLPTWSDATATSIFDLRQETTPRIQPRDNFRVALLAPISFDLHVTVIPCTPIAVRASRTSSSLKGLITGHDDFHALESPFRPGLRSGKLRADTQSSTNFPGVTPGQRIKPRAKSEEGASNGGK